MVLRAMGTSREARAALRPYGFGKEAEAEGWRLLMDACGAGEGSTREDDLENPRANALERIDAWVEPGFRRARAALGRLHPAQDAFLFGRIAPDVVRVVALMAFLDGCDELERSPKRKATRRADHAALATLAARGITKEVRDELRALVRAVQTVSAPSVANDDKTEQLAKLYAWLQDWAETAKAVVKDRNVMIKLGFAKRRPRNGSTATTSDVAAKE
jgi:hypothetical protein